MVGESKTFHVNQKPARRVFHDSYGSADGSTNPSWVFTKLNDKTRETISVEYPWPDGKEALSDEQINAFNQNIQELLKDGWTSLGGKRIFNHRNSDTQRWIRPPVDGLLVWFDGQRYEKELGTIETAIKQYNVIATSWSTRGWEDIVPKSTHDFVEPPQPYFRTIYAGEDSDPDDLATLDSWELDPLSNDRVRFGPAKWIWNDGSVGTSIFVQDKENGVCREFRKNRLMREEIKVSGMTQGIRHSFEEDGGISSIQIFEQDELASEFDVERSVLVPNVSYRPVLRERLEVALQSGECIDDWEDGLEGFEINSNEGFKADKFGNAKAIVFKNFELDMDRLRTMVKSKAFLRIERFSLENLSNIEAFELASLIAGGFLNHIRHLKLDSLQMFVNTDGVQQALVSNCLRLPNIKSLQLQNLTFLDRDTYSSKDYSDEQMAEAICNVAMSSVQKLSLHLFYKVSDKSVAAIVALPHLKVLDLAYVSVAADGLRAILESDIENLSYQTSNCGESLGLQIPFVKSELEPLFERLAEKLISIDICVHATKSEIGIGAIAELVKDEPNEESFRRILLSLQAQKDDADGFAAGLKIATDALTSWPEKTKNPQPYFVNGLVDGWIPPELLSLVGCLRISDLALDPKTHAPTGYDDVAARFAKFAERIGEIPGSVKHLDLSPRSWMTALRPSRGDLWKYSMPLEASFWDAIATAPAFSALESLDLSKPSYDYTPYRHSDYTSLYDFMSGFDSNLGLLDILEQSEFKQSLKILKFENLDPAYFGDAGNVSLPVLEFVDISSGSRLGALDFLNRIKAPKLKHVELRGDSMTYFALDTKFDSLNEDDAGWLGHDWMIADQEDLDNQLFNQNDIRALFKAAPKANFVLGGEISAKKVGENKKLSEQRYASPDPITSW